MRLTEAGRALTALVEGKLAGLTYHDKCSTCGVVMRGHGSYYVQVGGHDLEAPHRTLHVQVFQLHKGSIIVRYAEQPSYLTNDGRKHWTSAPSADAETTHAVFALTPYACRCTNCERNRAQLSYLSASQGRAL